MGMELLVVPIPLLLALHLLQVLDLLSQTIDHEGQKHDIDQL